MCSPFETGSEDPLIECGLILLEQEPGPTLSVLLLTELGVGLQVEVLHLEVPSVSVLVLDEVVWRDLTNKGVPHKNTSRSLELLPTTFRVHPVAPGLLVKGGGQKTASPLIPNPPEI